MGITLDIGTNILVEIFKILVRNWREYPSKGKNYITNYITYTNWYVKKDCTIAYPRFLTTVQGGAIVGTVLEMTGPEDVDYVMSNGAI